MENIKWNNMNTNKRPVFTCFTDKGETYGVEVEIFESCKVVYRPDQPLPNDVKAWIETEGTVIVTDHSGHTEIIK